MKNFSDLLATDQQLIVSIGLSVITDAGLPVVEIRVNGQRIFDGELADSITVINSVNVRQPFNLAISMKDKIYQEDLETAVIINSINVDGHELIPNFTHLACYDNDHGINNPTSYLGWNGTWNLGSDQPFYQWLHVNTGQGWLLKPI